VRTQRRHRQRRLMSHPALLIDCVRKIGSGVCQCAVKVEQHSSDILQGRRPAHVLWVASIRPSKRAELAVNHTPLCTPYHSLGSTMMMGEGELNT